MSSKNFPDVIIPATFRYDMSNTAHIGRKDYARVVGIAPEFTQVQVYVNVSKTHHNRFCDTLEIIQALQDARVGPEGVPGLVQDRRIAH